ncbi:MAG: hypothetical protein A2W99_17370 [Bacteroidetes bacterium GWF2_33_16]|nr:MAG: hypothetical protein A2X00_14510 [Bacteroidetes bacterium GWE2_32_14]OFY06810.1 MAG: hypothetical protein A2W99_17370 [Bacteroidetes bacterium GWF2_33_16]
MKKNYSITHFGKILLFFLSGTFLLSQNSYSQLTGTYTIGTTGDYTTISAAVTALTNDGISGPVTFNISAGDYHEQLVIQQISGVSPIDTIVFQSASGDTADVKIYYEPSSSLNYVIHLDGADYISFKDLSLFAKGADNFGVVVKITGNCNYNKFIGNHFYGKTGTSANLGDKVIVAGDLGSVDTATIFENNKFEHGKYGVKYSYGKDIVFKENIFISGESDQLTLSNFKSADVFNNKINGPVNFSYNGTYGLNFYSNTLIGSVSLYSLYPTGDFKTKIYNNFISGSIFVSSCSGVNIYYNSVVASGSYPLRLYSGGSNYKILNNIFKSLNASYPAMSIGDISYVDTLDYNNLFTIGALLVEAATINYATLSEWQAAVNQSAHSFNDDVTFDDWTNADMHISLGTPKLFGTSISEITTDFDGDARYMPRPNIGADEYTKAPLRGTYVVDKSGMEDYISFATAIADLNNRGVDSAVVINVNEGEYNEQIEITEIEGSSEINTITIQSASGDTADVKIYYDPATTDLNYTVYLNGSDYLRFKNLSIYSSGTSAFGNVILLKNEVKDIQFDGNHFYGKTGDCIFKDKYLVRDDLSTNDTSIVFTENTFEHSRGFLYMDYNINLTISNNSFINGETNYAGSSLSFIENGLIEGNFMEGSLNLDYALGNSSNIVRNNVITNIFDLYSLNTVEGKEALVYNNFIKYKLVIRSCAYTKIYNNTVSSTACPTTIDNLCSNITLHNNIFITSNSGYSALDIDEIADIASENYNCLYTPGTTLVKCNSVNYSTLADWQSFSGMSANSYNQNLTFVDAANNDLHIASGNPDLLGIPIAGINRDIDEEIRNVNTPNIGADEYSVQPMSGTYTIGKNGIEDYTSFSEAVEALVFNGISEDTYFEVSSGIYEEQISIPSITGASADAGIVFYPKSGNQKDVVLTYKINDVDKNYIVNLAGVDYIYFQKIEFLVDPSSSYGVIFDFNNGASHNGITYCDLKGLNIASQTDTYSLIFSKYNGSNDSYNIISDNTFKYGSMGVYFSSLSPSDMELGNEISNNNLLDQYYAAINLVFQDSCTVKSDTINISSAHLNPYGVYLMYCKREMVFNNNIKIASTALTAGGYGIYDYYGTGEYNKRASIFNNFIKIITSNGTVSGITLNNTPYRDIYYNTVDIYGLNIVSQALRVINAATEAFYSNNNIFSNRAGGYAFYTDVSSSIFASNYNDFYTTGSVLIKTTDTDCETLEEWQTLASRDADSYSVDPRFISDGDLHIYHANKYLNASAQLVATGNSNLDYYLIRDIDLESRSNPCDIGADEYTYISEENDFLTFSLTQQTGDAIINTENHTISIEVDYGTVLTALVATFTISENAAVAVGLNAQSSGTTANDFTSPVIYTITAQDGTAQNWIVTVTTALNDENDILTFSFAEHTGNAVINATDHTIDIEVEYGTNLSVLVATYTLSPDATAKIGTTDQTSETTVNNFTSDVVYTIVAQNGDEQNWTVSVTTALNSENDIVSYSMAEQSASSTINTTNHTVALQVVPGTSLSDLVATFTLSGDAKVYVNSNEQVSGTTANTFTNPVVYKVVAQDGTEQDWTVTVTVEPYHGKDILTFSFAEQTSAAIINNTAHTVAVTVNSSANLSSLVASFTLSNAATATVEGTTQVSSTSSNNFTSAVTYRITAQDATYQDWIVTVSKVTGIDDIENIYFAIYPNPAVSYINIETEFGIDELILIEIVDVTGKVKLAQTEYAERGLKATVNLPSDINAGLYFVSIRSEERTVTKRLIVK